MEKNKIYIVILTFLLLIMFTVIFNFSNQDGEKSLSVSKAVTEKIVEEIDNVRHVENPNKLKNDINKVIRKIAHFSLYMLVGIIAMYLMILAIKGTIKKKILLTLIIGITYAILDEIHQLYIPGRSALITDVGIDTCGVLAGIVIVFLIMNIIKSLKANNAT